jgi:EAL domain-containing protein (putative c-di-GMP-specific phosphodiesterase class I)
VSVDDVSRQHRLARHYLTGSSPRLQETLALAAAALDFPHGQVNILDATLLHTITDHHGVGRRVMPRAESMCTFTVDSEGVLAIDDLRLDPRSVDLPGVRSGMAASYLGVVLRSREAANVGTLCFFDTRPRQITTEQIQQVLQFGRIIEDSLDLIRRAEEHKLPGPSSPDSLAAAIDHGEIVPWFQSVIDLRSDQVVAHEALARWQHPDGEIRSPAAFIPLAEDSDLIVDLDRTVLRQALAALAHRPHDTTRVRLAVNISTRHLEIPDGVSTIHHAVLAAGIAPVSIALELTETRELADPDLARESVTLLRGYGYDVVLDDFGTGWSSLDWVLGLPISGIKIDRAVTAALGSPAGDAAAHAVIGLARELDLEIVMEGIATRQHYDTALSLDIHYGQGYYWAPPRPEI